MRYPAPLGGRILKCAPGRRSRQTSQVRALRSSHCSMTGKLILPHRSVQLGMLGKGTKQRIRWASWGSGQPLGFAAAGATCGAPRERRRRTALTSTLSSCSVRCQTKLEDFVQIPAVPSPKEASSGIGPKKIQNPLREFALRLRAVGQDDGYKMDGRCGFIYHSELHGRLRRPAVFCADSPTR